MSYERCYTGGWASAESGGTPITPEALNHMEEGIIQAGRVTIQCGKRNVNSKANTNVMSHIDFDEAFVHQPVVLTTLAVADANVARVSVQNLSATGFDIVLYRSTSTATSIQWAAFGE